MTMKASPKSWLIAIVAILFAGVTPVLASEETKSLPVVRVEKQARTQQGQPADPRQKSSAVAPTSAPRQAVSKAGIAPEIVALAESLGNSPGRIFRFVHDSIDFDPKWGASKSPLGTLWEGLGTAWDQAWLLQQLLAATGVDARLEWGEVEITPELLASVAGVEDPFRAGDLLTTAGTPIVLVVGGSQVVGARMSHVWVKAHLDYMPNRGATPGPGDTWVRLDPSLKRFEIGGGVRLDEQVPFALGEYLPSGTLLSPRQSHEEALLTYATDNGLGVGSVEELKRSRTLVEEAFPFVPGTLRGRILSVAGESVDVPEAFEQRLELQVRSADGAVLLDWSTPWSAVYGQRLEIAWPGATPADQAALDLNGGIFATPPYEVDLRPTIRLEAADVVSGDAIGSAESVELLATVTPPQGSVIVAQLDMFAGENAVLAVDFGRIPQAVVDRFSLERDTASESSEQATWALALAGVTYLRDLAADLDHLGGLRWRRVVQLGNVILATQRGAVSSAPDGTPLTFSQAPPGIALGAMVLGLFVPQGDAPSAASAVATLELLGSQASFLEAATLADVLGGDHVSAVTFLTRAVRQGQALSRVDATNVTAALAEAELSTEAEAAVQAAVAQGLIAWISEAQLLIDSWSTTGYVLEEPQSGRAGYFVTYERLAQPLDADVVFHAPLDLDEVTEPIDVVATVNGEDVDSWSLSYRAADGGPAVQLASGTGSVANAVLGQFDPTLLLNGLYDLVLTARDAAGQSRTEKISVVVEGSMKIGNFSLSFRDLAIPLSGLDIELVRDYDTRDKSEGDFGRGWSLEVRQGSYRNNRLPGDGWQILPGILPCEAILETKTHLTTIRLSDREIYRFKLRLVDASVIAGGCFARAEFEYVDGPVPGATLEIMTDGQVFYANGSNVVVRPDSQEIFLPRQVRLITRDGRQFEVDLQAGVRSLRDPNGNTLTITENGITHSSGKGTIFVRDQEGRITSIVDPAGNALSYEYDADGNLVSFLDQEGNRDTYTYGSQGLMTEIENPRGNAIRNEYDEAGRLVRTIDALGNSIDLTHQIGDRREVIRDRRGLVRTFEYDSRGNVIREVDAAGKVIVRIYDDNDNLLSETDQLGHTTAFAYDENFDLVGVTDALGNTVQQTFDERGQPLTRTDARGNTVSFAYDASGNLLRRTDALGGVQEFTYDASGNVTSTVDAEGNTTAMTYNTFGEVLSVTNPVGDTVSYAYDLNGNRLSETRTRATPSGPETLETAFAFDKLGRNIGVVYPDGGVEASTYDGMDNRLSVTDAIGNVTTFSFDAQDQLTLVADADGLGTQQVFDPEGKVVRQISRAGKVSEVEYDPNHRLVSVELPGGLTSQNLVDDLGRNIGSVNAAGVISRVELDAVGLMTRRIDALGRATVFSRDANGNVLSVTEPGGQSTSFEYDAADRPVSITLPGGLQAHTAYNAVGLITTASDPLGRVVSFGYDGAGRLTSVTDAAGTVTSYAYDELGRVASRTDSNGNETRFTYDRNGNVESRILADGSLEIMDYNPAGRSVGRTDFNGVRTSFEHNSLGQVIEERAGSDEPIVYTYASSGRRSTVVDDRGTTTYAYDETERLVEVTHPDGRRLIYGYDLAGKVATVTADVGQATFETSYTFDDLGRLIEIVDPLGGVYAYAYTPAGDLESLTYPNGVVTTYVFDALHQLTELESRTAEGVVIQSYTYDSDDVGRRTRVSELGGAVEDYQYDALDRVVRETRSQGGVILHEGDFVYDDVGNRVSNSWNDSEGTVETSYTYDNRDRLLTFGGRVNTWDNNGNLATHVDPESGTTVYTWDSRDRLRSISLPDGTIVSHDYGVEDQRIRTAVVPPGGTGSAREYLVDTKRSLNRVIAEIDAADGAVTVYVYGIGVGPVALIRAGEIKYLHADGLGSTRLLTDANGAVTDRYSYSAFGELLEHLGDDPNRFLFAGAAYDSETGLYDLHARWMDPRTGRFLSMDPVMGRRSEARTQHAYLYAAADPVNKLDPDGRSYLSLAFIFKLNRPAPETLKVEINYPPLWVRVQPFVHPDSDWLPAEVLGRIDHAAELYRRRAGVIPYYFFLDPIMSGDTVPSFANIMSKAEVDVAMEDAAAVAGKKTVALLYLNEFTSRTLRGRALSPEFGFVGRAGSIARYYRDRVFDDEDVSIIEDDVKYGPRKETCAAVDAHELGHALGLMHTFGNDQIMSGFGVKCSASQLKHDQINKVRQVAFMLK